MYEQSGEDKIVKKMSFLYHVISVDLRKVKKKSF